ncbi:response regulator [Kovacikia minuta CCNUW1]|uniref:response regulator n=1 Tax=Kovacikia minuta TaxID=2931930 RepID=UPI001CCEFA32|nr:response regulator [Kovacikia minuta]UBF27650.1 response regulator [Kovacikia minuta CCNUW1]
MPKKQTTLTVQAQTNLQREHQTPTESLLQEIPEPKRLLLVNNNPEFVTLMQDYLEFLGYEVITAETNLAALETLKSKTPDVVIAEHKHPEVNNGHQLFSRLRQETSPYQQIPIVILADETVSEPDLFLQEHADGYFPIPVEPTELIALLQRILKRSPDDLREKNGFTQPKDL